MMKMQETNYFQRAICYLHYSLSLLPAATGAAKMRVLVRGPTQNGGKKARRSRSKGFGQEEPGRAGGGRRPRRRTPPRPAAGGERR